MSEPNIDKWIDRAFLAFLVIALAFLLFAGSAMVVMLWGEILK